MRRLGRDVLAVQCVNAGHAALRISRLAEVVGHNIDDLAQAEVRKPSEDFRGGRVALVGGVLEATFMLLDAGADLRPDRR